MTYNMPDSTLKPRVELPTLTVLWKGTLFGICATSIYQLSTRPDSILYEFHDVPPATLTSSELHNFFSIKEAGEFTVTTRGDDIADLVDILIAELEHRYISGTLAAYNKELSNGSYRH